MLKILSGIVLVGILLTALMLGCKSEQKAPPKSDQQVTAANLKKVTLDVYGMTCSGCEYNVKSALKKIDGVARVEADYKNDRAEVEFDPSKASIDQLVDAVNKSGYQAKIHQTN